ncbi:hypothetical protein [Budvicia aquatica]|uniref:hypothetical protein n=1 Tax=Budvicia aquatica TaxID=82979 RepID=UPI0021C415EA|nr:hypothetical protein [Budvicia aquatica]
MVENRQLLNAMRAGTASWASRTCRVKLSARYWLNYVESSDIKPLSWRQQMLENLVTTICLAKQTV